MQANPNSSLSKHSSAVRSPIWAARVNDGRAMIPNDLGACPADGLSPHGAEECAASGGWDKSWMIRR